MLSPQKIKYRRHHRGKMKGATKGHSELNFGEIGLKCMDTAWITSRQIEAARIAMTRHIKRGGKVWITIFPDKAVSKKPAETRMGSGKGAPEFWVACVKPGRIMFEIGGVDYKLGKRALELAAAKLPVNCKIVVREEVPL